VQYCKLRTLALKQKKGDSRVRIPRQHWERVLNRVLASFLAAAPGHEARG